MKTNWQSKKLGEVCDFRRGLTYSKNDEVGLSSNIVLRANNIDIKTNRLDFTELKYISDDIVITPEKKVSKGALMICTASGSKSHLGKIALIDDNYDYAFGGFMGQLAPRPNVDSKFLFYRMTSDAYKEFIDKLSDGVNINNLRFDDLAEFPIPLPPLPEQKRIVKVLDEVFEGIAKAKANAEKNLANARELFESYLQGTFNKPQTTAHNLCAGQVTQIKKKLGDVCEELSAGGDVPKNNFSKIKTDKFNIPIFANGITDKGLYGYTDIARVTKPSVTVSARGTIGYTEIRKESFYPIVRLIVLVPNKDLIGLSFLKYAASSIDFSNTGVSIPQLTVPMVREYEISLPPLPEQESIVAKLDALSEQTKKLEGIYQQKLAGLEELKKSVLKKAFEGEL